MPHGEIPLDVADETSRINLPNDFDMSKFKVGKDASITITGSVTEVEDKDSIETNYDIESKPGQERPKHRVIRKRFEMTVNKASVPEEAKKSGKSMAESFDAAQS